MQTYKWCANLCIWKVSTGHKSISWYRILTNLTKIQSIGSCFYCVWNDSGFILYATRIISSVTTIEILVYYPYQKCISCLSTVWWLPRLYILYLDECSSGRKGFTKNVPARNPTPMTECTAMVNGLDLTGPIVYTTILLYKID